MMRGDQAGGAEGTPNKGGVETFNVSSLSVNRYSKVPLDENLLASSPENLLIRYYSKLPCKVRRRKPFAGVL